MIFKIKKGAKMLNKEIENMTTEGIFKELI